ncbi:MAG: hypothetical protein EOO18_05440 [Chryseobacterium sp.]|nr:MAG: hypothetical protein EOO18_05440 [Chryseobacterium sp.]
MIIKNFQGFLYRFAFVIGKSNLNTIFQQQIFGFVFSSTRNIDHNTAAPNVGSNFSPSRSAKCLLYAGSLQQIKGVDRSGESLNDKLKQNQSELQHRLIDTPIKDLRKAIGINDRFLFINELFRGDEPMYERSIKTINNFNIYPEAEYWITRELITKLGWNADAETVVHFLQLVKRRFS